MQDIRRPMFLYFFAALLIGAGISLNDSTFNNFLSSTFDLKANTRGWLEFPRELPGLLVVLMAGLLSRFAVTHLGAIAAAIFASAMFGLAIYGTYGYCMVFFMVMGSAGLHLNMPVSTTIAIGLSHATNRGKRMGQFAAIGSMGGILGMGMVSFLVDKQDPNYTPVFVVSGILASAAIIMYMCIHIPSLHLPRQPLVFRRKFLLYYFMELLFGARKQIFITFGFWVLIKIYHQPAPNIAMAMTITAAMGLFFSPLVGWAIDRFGERSILIVDGFALALVCLGYGYAIWWMGSVESALPLAYACFMLDNLLFSLGMGRSVYMSRLADSPQEASSTIAMGISINHLVSMLIPGFAGLLWIKYGYERVFAAAAVLALMNAAVATLVPRKGVLAK